MTTIADDYGTQDQAALEAVGSALADIARRLDGVAVDKESMTEISGEVKALVGYLMPAKSRIELLDSIGRSVQIARESDAQRRHEAAEQERQKVIARMIRPPSPPPDRNSPEHTDRVNQIKRDYADLAGANEASDAARTALASMRFVRRWCAVCRLVTERVDAPEGSDDPGYCMQCWGKYDYYKIDFRS